MDNIYFEEYDKFLREIDLKRNDLYTVDYNMIKERPEKVEDIDEFQIKNGRFDVKVGELELECFLYLKEDRPLYIMFSGALNDYTPPQFNRWSYYRQLNGSVLAIADPMYNHFKDLKLGWYYGTDQYNLRTKIAEFIEKFARKIGLTNKEIVFFTSSGGGSAAVECAALLPGSTAIVINPQLVLKEWDYAPAFEGITGNDLSKDCLGHRNNVIWHIRNCSGSKYIIMINVRNATDMQQAKNLCTQLNIRLKYGINIFEYYIIWLYDAEGGAAIASHNMQEFRELVFVIEYIWQNFNCITEAKFGDFSRLVNEFWRSHWEMRKLISANQALNIGKFSKKVAVFGTGLFLEYLSKESFHISSHNYYGIQIAIDNDKKKAGQLLWGTLPIVHASEVKDWSELFVIITTDVYYAEIMHQLKALGLVYGVNFILWRDLA
uniref:hypothetical protein n=1 Tax=Acetatifactor sp. TaxID=1872090 RepID=UPI0040570B80